MKLFSLLCLFFSISLQAGEWVAHQSSLTAQRATLEQSKKQLMELNLSLSKAKDEASRKELEKQIDKLKKQLRDDEARFTEEAAHVALQHPEQGENIKTTLDSKRIYNYAPRPNSAAQKEGISQLLERVHQKMVSVYGDHSVPLKKERIEFKFQKEADERKNIELNRPALSLEIDDDGNREPIHEAPKIKAPEPAQKGGH